jgi:hypothetical protein
LHGEQALERPFSWTALDSVRYPEDLAIKKRLLVDLDEATLCPSLIVKLLKKQCRFGTKLKLDR